MFETIKREWEAKVAIVFFLVMTAWWVYNNFIIGNSHVRYDTFFDFGEFYGYIAVAGGIWGILISRRWGGFKSVIGRAILMMAFGLFAQEFGQLSYAWYNDIYKTPGPYPSLGDIGFFGSIFFYAYGISLFAHAAGATITLRQFMNKLQAVIIPLIMLCVGYYLFLQGYKFDWSKPLTIFLDFGYPLGEAIYVSLAILTYTLSVKLLGGVMKSKILFIVLALSIQFLSDYTFLYQNSRNIYQVGGINDYMYFLAYFAMAVGLLQFKTVLKKLKGK